MLPELIQVVTIDCPFCGECFESSIDLSAGGQTYFEDCWICCRPIVVSYAVAVDGTLSKLDASRDD